MWCVGACWTASALKECLGGRSGKRSEREGESERVRERERERGEGKGVKSRVKEGAPS